MKKKLAKILIIALTCQSMLIQAYASEINLSLNGTLQQMQTAPVIINSNAFVDAYEIFTLIGAEVDWDRENSVITAFKNNTLITINLGSVRAKVNETVIILPVEPKEEQGIVLIPLRFAVESLGEQLEWNAAKQELRIIITGNFIFNNDILKMEVPQNSEAVILTYDEALQKAIENNNTLETIEDTMEYIEEQIKNAEADYRYSMLTYNDLGEKNYLRALLALNQQVENKPLNEEIIKGTTELLLRATLKSISDYQVDIQLLKESIALSEIDLKNLELKLSLGLVSENDVKQARQNFEQSQTNLQALELQVEDQKLVLNNLLGYNPIEKVVIDYNPRWEPMNFDIEKAIGNIPSDPSIKLKESAVKNAQYEYDTAQQTTITELNAMNAGAMRRPQDSIIEKGNALAQAQRELENSKINMEKALYATYNNVIKLETNQKSLEIDLQKAIDTYHTAIVSFEAGMITEYEVNASKLNILKSESAIAKNLYNIEVLKFRLEKPYLLSSEQ